MEHNQVPAILAKVGFSRASFHVTDRKLSSKTAADSNASRNTIRVRKTILESPHLDKVNRIMNNLRNNVVYPNTLPWNDEGWRFVPVADYDRVFKRPVQKAQDELRVAVNEFIEQYQNDVEAMRSKLGDAFNESDYPSASKLRDAFRIEVELQPMPTKDVRLDVSEETRREIAKSVEDNIASRLNAAVEGLIDEAREIVQHAVTTMREYKVVKGKDGKRKTTGRLYETTLSKVADLVERIPRLNLTNDPRLNTLYEELRGKVHLIEDSKKVKTDTRHRNKAANELDAMLADILGESHDIAA